MPGTKVIVIFAPVPEVGIIRVGWCRTYWRGHGPSAGSTRTAGAVVAQGPHRGPSPCWRLAPCERAVQDVVAASPHSDFMDNVDHHVNATRTEPGVYWRMVSRGPGYRVDTPTDCPEPIQWVGRGTVKRKRIRLWTCGRHVEGPAELQPAGQCKNARPTRLGSRGYASTGCHSGSRKAGCSLHDRCRATRRPQKTLVGRDEASVRCP